MTTTEIDIDLPHALIVDDHPLFCDALALTLRSVPGVETVTKTVLLEAALDHIDSGAEISVILLDLNLPDVSGFDGLVRLRKAAGEIPILVVSSMSDNQVIHSVLRAGAQGFVPKHSQRDVFLRAFAALSRGELFMPDDYVEIADDDRAPSARDMALERLSTLTNQQDRILQMICEGKLNKQIAYDLSIAETTVKAHVTAIMRKLGVHSRTQAVLIAGQAQFANVLPSGGDSP